MKTRMAPHESLQTRWWRNACRSAGHLEMVDHPGDAFGGLRGTDGSVALAKRPHLATQGDNATIYLYCDVPGLALGMARQGGKDPALDVR